MPFGGYNWRLEMVCLKQCATLWALLLGLDAPRQRLPIIDKVPHLGLVPYAGSDSRPWYLSSPSALSLSHCSRTLYLISHVGGICRWGRPIQPPEISENHSVSSYYFTVDICVFAVRIKVQLKVLTLQWWIDTKKIKSVGLTFCWRHNKMSGGFN